MWLGDKITSKGIGNGISMLIFAGIVSSLPSAVVAVASGIIVDGQFSTTGLLTAIGIFNRCTCTYNRSSICTISRKKNTSTIF